MRRCRPLLGTYVEIDADSAEAVEAGFAAIGQMHALMSAHEPESDVGRINRFGHLGPVVVSDDTSAVLERALEWWRLSEGVFDILRAGAASLAAGRIPLHAHQPAPRAEDSSALSLAGNSVRLHVPGCVDLGGIAKGFAVDQAVAAMRRAGATRGMVNAGGDIAAFGAPCPVTIIHPLTRRPTVEVELCDSALATSAVHADGRRDHLPAGSHWISVTVRARHAWHADALTKIVWAQPSGLGEMLKRRGLSAMGIRPDGTVQEISANRLAA